MIEDSLIAGSSQWMCKNPETQKYSPILRKIRMKPKIDYNLMTIQLETQAANYGDFFENLKLLVQTNARMHHHSR